MTKLSKQQIIKTTQALIAKNQSTNLSLSQIAKSLGITHAALYKHFKDKDDLWTAVSIDWFQKNILTQVVLDPTQVEPAEDLLYQLLLAFAKAKKKAATEDPLMFALNTNYIDDHPYLLNQVLTPIANRITQLLKLNDPTNQQAEAVLSAFAVFALPMFQPTWDQPDYQQRFDQIWQLIRPGLFDEK